MNFFEHQDRARRSTTWLVVLFVCAVIAIVGAINLVAFAAERFNDSHSARRYPAYYRRPTTIFDEPRIYGAVTLATLCVIVGGSFYKTAQLSAGGGAAVAQMLGGTPLAPNSTANNDRM